GLEFINNMYNNNLFLKNGSKIAIIGGGPAGCFFAHFASRYATEMGIDVSIRIFDRKDFCQMGPRGCNMCAGVVSENLFNKLEEEGINIPPFCAQRKIEGYYLQTQDESVLLHHPAPGHVPKIVTVFRGNGPILSTHQGNVSFDDFLLNHVKKQGVEVISGVVKGLKLPSRKGDPINVIFGEGESKKEFEADLVVGAFGVNTGMMERIANMDFGYKPPKTVRTCQCEIMLGNEYIEKTFGSNVFVIELGKKELKFASITLKADYITVSLVGRQDLTRNNLIDFLNHPAVRRLMPKDWEIPNSFCMCISKIPVTYAKHPYTDRIVILGDASISRAYKSGIESAFNMAKLSAYTAFKYGVSERAFMNGYFKPAKRLLARDNLYGIVMLKINDYISSQRQIANAHIRMLKSDKDTKTTKLINEILWNMFTGNAPYKEIFYKAINPRLALKILPISMIAWARQKMNDINAWLEKH
ncbi:MAG: NAD(P)/FAD-dependent oxidoreductase, partial [Candidatus Scalinduaceae bacterium]